MATDHIPARVRQVAEQAAAALKAGLPPGWKVIWFGSWPSGNAAERSDLDLGVLGPQPLEPAVLSRLVEAVEAIETLYKIDVVDLCATGEKLRNRALDEGIEL